MTAFEEYKQIRNENGYYRKLKHMYAYATVDAYFNDEDEIRVIGDKACEYYGESNGSLGLDEVACALSVAYAKGKRNLQEMNNLTYREMEEMVMSYAS